MSENELNSGETSPPPAAPFEHTFDATKDEKVLEHLWEILKFRFSEEKARQDGARDRAAKLIGFSFSTLAFNAAVIVLTRDTLREFRAASPENAGNAYIFLCIILAGAFVGFAISLLYSLQVLASSEYRTWNEDDLRQVELGGEKNEYGYWRFLLKAGWTQVTHSHDLNSRKVKQSDTALYAFLASAFCTLIFVFFIGVLALTVKPIEKKAEPTNIVVNATCPPPQTKGPENMSDNPKPAPATSPKPTPQPTQGKKITNSFQPKPQTPAKPQPPAKK